MHQRARPLDELLRAAANPKYDRIVCLGDYVDDFVPEIPATEYLERIFALKTAHPERIILLLGNHDAQYLHPNRGLTCSGYQPQLAPALTAAFQDHHELLCVAYTEEERIFTHAGIGRAYYAVCRKKYGAETVSEVVALTNQFPPEVGYISPVNGGHHPFDGPLWLRPWTYREEVFTDYEQVVGHTPHQAVTRYGNMVVRDTFA